MQRISTAWIVELIEQIDLVQRKDLELDGYTIRAQLYETLVRLRELFNHSVLSPHLSTCYDSAIKLASDLEALALVDDPNIDFDDLELRKIKIKISDFKTVFLAELTALPIFVVVPKAAFNTDILIEKGTELFPASMLGKVPSAEKDAMEVGKALAFNLPTSCGFHTFRVTEAVLKSYWDHVSSKEKRPRLETIGNYAAELENKNFGDKKVWETLKQIAKLHRNPIIHPEVILDLEEAIETLGVARSAIGAMLKIMPDVKNTTGI